ncbi:putative reverse transcriptase domain-containing protein [Tanacetum coccineum]|uniref:Reverse transcriptase domain-containing protein n=1 Tax=Tanacetum coccineum TaxID=301880 RepID=A0ABQ5GGQ0_9ASTR
MRREMSDMQAELLALREPQRTARQPGPEARIPDHQEASGDADMPTLELLKRAEGEIKKLEIELWNLKVKGNDVPAYTERFQELTLICTKFVANETEKVDKYLSGLPDNIYGNVKAAKPKTLDETIELANDLMDRKLLTYAERQSDNKRKADDSSRNNHGHQQQPFKRQNVARAYNMGTGERKPYGGSLPKCNKCHLHHNGPCTQRCHKCNKIGHFARDCRSTGNTNVANTQKGNGATPKGNGCFECGAPGHFKRDCPKLKNKNGGNGNAQGWVYAVGNAEKRGDAPGNPDANVVTGTFLLNNHYASILFDTGADRSFISTAFSSLINIAPTSLENCYDVELADGKLVKIDTIIRGCTLNFLDHPFNIDLMPVELGSFDVIIGMDWLRRYHAVIVCDEKLVQVPYGNETLTFRGNESSNGRESRLAVISYSKAQEYMAKGCQVFLAQIFTKKEEDKSERKQIEDVPIVRDFPEVFPEDLPGLPPARPVEFQIDLIPGAAPVARAPYRLAPSEMKELSEQLQELSDKGFIRPSSSPWGAKVGLGPCLFVKMKDGSFRHFSGHALIAEAYMWTGHKIESIRIGISKDTYEDPPIYSLAVTIEGKANVVADALSRKERIEPLRVRAFVFDNWFGYYFQTDLRSSDRRPEYQRISYRRTSFGYLAMETYDPVICTNPTSRNILSSRSEKMYQDCERNYFWWPKHERADIAHVCIANGAGHVQESRPNTIQRRSGLLVTTRIHQCVGRGWGSPTNWSRLSDNNETDSPDQEKGCKRHRTDKMSYARSETKPMEFDVGDRVLLMVSLEKECTFRRKNHVDDMTTVCGRAVEIMEREIKRLKRSGFHLVKVR